MVINTSLDISLRCARCGEHEAHRFSLFSLSGGGGGTRLKCDCGSHKMMFNRDRRGQGYQLNMICPICEIPHSFRFTTEELFGDKLHILYCKDTGIEICVLGQPGQVEKRSKEQEQVDVFDDFNYHSYFNNAEVMFKCINYLHTLAGRGDLVCLCGSKRVDVNVFPEKIELACSRCHSLGLVLAETEDDYGVLRKIDRIEMKENSFKRVDTQKAYVSNNNQRLD